MDTYLLPKWSAQSGQILASTFHEAGVSSGSELTVCVTVQIVAFGCDNAPAGLMAVVGGRFHAGHG